MANSSISVTEGSGKNIASYSVSETTTKEIQRVSLNDSSGVELTSNIGSLTETAPATDTASSGLNGRLQRIAQRLTTVIAGLVVTGGTASGSALANAPVTVGGLAKTANPTAVADAQVVNALYDKLGKQVVVGSVRDLKVNQVTTITASTSETTILTAVGSTFLDLYGLIISNTSATAVKVAVKDSTSGTTQLNIAVPAGDTRGFMLPESGAIKQGTVNNNWTATSSDSVSSLVITALAVKNI